MKAFLKKLPAPIPLLCYAAALLYWLCSGVAMLAGDGVAAARGRLRYQAVPLERFELVDLETDGGILATTSGDPQMLLADLGGQVVRTLRMRVQFSHTPREICLYYTSRPGEPFSREKRVFAARQDDGSYLFDLPAGHIEALRLDPCSPAAEQQRIELQDFAVELNVPRPWYHYFGPGWYGAFCYLVWPGLAAAALRCGWDFWRWARSGWRKIKNKQ